MDIIFNNVLYQLKAYFYNKDYKELDKWIITNYPKREYIKYIRFNCCHFYTFPCNKCSKIILSKIL